MLGRSRVTSGGDHSAHGGWHRGRCVSDFASHLPIPIPIFMSLSIPTSSMPPHPIRNEHHLTLRTPTPIPSRNHLIPPLLQLPNQHLQFLHLLERLAPLLDQHLLVSLQRLEEFARKLFPSRWLLRRKVQRCAGDAVREGVDLLCARGAEGVVGI